MCDIIKDLLILINDNDINLLITVIKIEEITSELFKKTGEFSKFLNEKKFDYNFLFSTYIKIRNFIDKYYLINNDDLMNNLNNFYFYHANNIIKIWIIGMSIDVYLFYFPVVKEGMITTVYEYNLDNIPLSFSKLAAELEKFIKNYSEIKSHINMEKANNYINSMDLMKNIII